MLRPQVKSVEALGEITGLATITAIAPMPTISAHHAPICSTATARRPGGRVSSQAALGRPAIGRSANQKREPGGADRASH
jgi:hypothetical protein